MNPTTETMIGVLTDTEAYQTGNFVGGDGAHLDMSIHLGNIRQPDHLTAAASCFADVIQRSGIRLDVVFSPSLQLIHLATATTLALWSQHRIRTRFASRNRPPYPAPATHIGEPLRGNQVVILDNLGAAATATYEACRYIQEQDGNVAAILVAADYPRGATPAQIADKTGAPVLTVIRREELGQLTA